MVGWHHQLNGHESEQTWGDSEGHGSLVCCSPWGRSQRVRHDLVTEQQQQRQQKLIVHVSVSLFCTLDFVPVICVSILSPIPLYLGYYSFIVRLEINWCESFNFFFIFKIGLTILVPLHFHIHFEPSFQYQLISCYDFDCD